MDDAGYISLEEDTDDVEAHGVEGWLLLGQVLFGQGADSALLARGDGLERVSVARSAAQFDLDEDQGVLVAQDQVQLAEAGAVVTLDERVASLGEVTQREVLAPGAGAAFAQGPTPA